jgi:demethylmenaquinone methyltransferase/2-methoxy-6-polyprenyl-1,4-benzoquinol methylase
VTVVPPGEGAIRPSDDVREMFNRIVPRYDLLNRVMTGGRDVAWRKLAVREALRHVNPVDARVLDVATGTGDLAIALRDARANEVVGLDFSAAMLAEAAHKDRHRPIGPPITWVEGDAMALPFPDASFDAVTVGFGLRNMPNYAAALGEMVRVLKPGGMLVCLETTQPSLPVLREGINIYFRQVVPFVGRLLSGDEDAYRYLPASSAVFPGAETLGQMMYRAGLKNVRYLLLAMGTVALHTGRKPEYTAMSHILD